MSFLLRLRRLPGALGVLWTALWDRRTPWRARLPAVLAALYLVWPLDLLPDFIPLAGWLDELVLVPLLLGLARRAMPPEVLARAEAAPRARRRWVSPALAAVAAILLLALLGVWLGNWSA
ncbi:YkvA family protein [Roseococcus sp. DSY-14]|uniref:YkvA family protein n=1 Tax=Roseococcus sp. DSY-14 TaxID=3369650 RepID=UPI00387B0327